MIATSLVTPCCTSQRVPLPPPRNSHPWYWSMGAFSISPTTAGHYDIAAQLDLRLLQRFDGAPVGGEGRFHIGAAVAIHPLVVENAGLVSLAKLQTVLVADLRGVHVAVEHQRRTAPVPRSVAITSGRPGSISWYLTSMPSSAKRSPR